MILRGTVQDGKNDANLWLSRFEGVYARWLGERIFPGSLNLRTGKAFDWHSPILSHRRTFSLFPHGGEREIFLVPARIVAPGRRDCWLWSTTTAADNRADPEVVELIASTRLRSALGLVNGSKVDVDFPLEWPRNKETAREKDRS